MENKKRFNIVVKFKQGNSLYFEVDMEENLRQSFLDNWSKSRKDGAFTIGEYIISTQELLWIRIEGVEQIHEEPSRK